VDGLAGAAAGGLAPGDMPCAETATVPAARATAATVANKVFLINASFEVMAPVPAD